MRSENKISQKRLCGKSFFSRIILLTAFLNLLLNMEQNHAGEVFHGGNIKQGEVSVIFTRRGVIEAVYFKGVKIMSQHPGGVSISGSKADKWKPYIPQGWGDMSRDIVMQKETGDKYTRVVVNGLFKSKAGTSRFSVTTMVFTDKIKQIATIRTSTKESWRRFGASYWLDGDIFAEGNYRADSGRWKLIPLTKGNRNLVWPKQAILLEIMSKKYKLTFRFDGTKTCFFDDRKPGKPNLNLEFNLAQQEFTNDRGANTYGGNFTVTASFSSNLSGKLPGPQPISPATVKTSNMDLTKPERLVRQDRYRLRYSLDGAWDLLPTGNLQDFPDTVFRYPVPRGKWSKTRVPVGIRYPTDGWKEKTHAAWYRTRFTVPSSLKGHRLYLHFEEISYDSRFYLNGRRVGRHFGGYIPVRLDITRTLNFGGPNMLEVFVGDSTAALDKSRYPAGAPTKRRWRNSIKPKSVIAPIYGAYKGILQSVYLDAVPYTYIDDVFVKTSVRKWRIQAEVSITNTLPSTRHLNLRAVVLDGRKTVKKLPARPFPLLPGQTKTVTIVTSWKDPKLWAVKQPNLYFMRTELMDGNEVIDAVITRFGFREFWCEGTSFYLNGVKIKLREAATHILYHPGRLNWKGNKWHGKTYEAARAEIESIQWANFNVSRMVHRPHPEFYYDITDELGHLAIAHMPMGFMKNAFNFQNPLLEPTTQRIVAGLVRKERNHPSIVIWCAENEGMPYGDNDAALRYANFYTQSIGRICKQLDPTRLVKYDRDGDLFGRAEIVDLHGNDSRNRTDMALPNSDWAHENRGGYGTEGGRQWRWQKDKPLYFGEGLYWMGTGKGPAARFIGERVFDDPQQGDLWYRGQEIYMDARLYYWKIGLAIWRMRNEAAGFCPWSVTRGFGTYKTDRTQPGMRFCREYMKPERFFLKQLYRNFYTKSSARLDICFLNDDYTPHKYTVEWKLIRKEQHIMGQTFYLQIAPAEVSWKAITLILPSVEQNETLALQLKMRSGERTVHEEAFPIRVYPRLQLRIPTTTTISLFDPVRTTAALFDRVNVKYTMAVSLSQAIKQKATVLVIGEQAVSEGLNIPPALDEYTRKGGRVLLLSQSTHKAYAPVNRPDSESHVTRAFVFACDRNHPLLKNVTQKELHFWNHPDWDQAHSIAVNSPHKFGQGNIHSILECDSLWFSPLQEAYYGKGLYIECSLDIVRKYNSEPLAARFWQNLIDRLATFKPRQWRPLFVLRDQAILKSLGKQGFACSSATKVPDRGIVLVTNASRVLPEEASQLAAFAKAGNTVWFHTRKNADISILQAITGTRIRVNPYPRDWRTRMVRRTPKGRTSLLLAGISSVALYARNSVDDIWNIKGDNATELATSGAVVEINLGTGKLIVERLNWDYPGNLPHRQWANHFLHSFATNLGVEIDIYRHQKRRIFYPQDFHLVDLRGVVNRGFRDETAGDGKGGWTDQGENDLRGMKTGRQTYHQIVFDIINPAQNNNRSCLVLHAKDNAPTGVGSTPEISVRSRAESIFFLHTSAHFNLRKHAGKTIIKYHLTYVDGTKQMIPAIGGRNIKDWWTPGNCDVSLGVSLLLKSKTEADALPRRRGLQLQEWQNPHPEKEIHSIRIESGETGVIPIVMAISLLKSSHADRR